MLSASWTSIADTRRRYDTELAAGGGVQRLRARRATRALVHGRVRPGALQPLRLDRGGVGDDRDPGGPVRGTGHRRPAAAPHPARDPRRRGASAGARRDRSHIRGPRAAVRGLHGPEQEPRAREGHADPGRPRPRRRAGSAVHRLARGRHDRLGRRERVPRPGRGGPAQRTPTLRTRSSSASRTSDSASDWSRSWCRAGAAT